MRYLVLIVLIFSGCILSGAPEDSELRLSSSTRYLVNDSTYVQLPIQVHLQSGSINQTFSPENLTETAWRVLPLDSHGNLNVQMDLLSTDGKVLASQRKTFTLQPDLLLSLSVNVSTGNPTARCLGCKGSMTTPLGQLEQFNVSDSLALTWGLDSKSKPNQY